MSQWGGGTTRSQTPDAPPSSEKPRPPPSGGDDENRRPPNIDTTTSQAARQAVDDNLDYQQAIIDLKRKYNDRFLNIISPRQLADLYIAEREFRQILLKRLNPQQHPGMYR